MNDQPNMPNDNDNVNELPPEDDVIHLPPSHDELDDVQEDNFVEEEEQSTPEPSTINYENGRDASDDRMNERLERLGGEPAPDITPEEFARLRQSGQIHIDPRGRVRSHRRSVNDAGVSLRKRRAWYID